MAKPIKPFFRFCKKCDNKYFPTGRYQKICFDCFNKMVDKTRRMRKKNKNGKTKKNS